MAGDRLPKCFSPHGELDRWSSAHSELDHLIHACAETLKRGNHAGAAEALEELVEAMQAHLSVEEEIYFPVIECFSSRHASTLEEARTAHVLVRTNLDEIRSRLTHGDIWAAQLELNELVDRFRIHEAAETRLIAALHREVAEELH